MSSDFATRIYDQAEELAGKMLSDYKREITGMLNSFEPRDSSEYLNAQIESESAILKMLPTFYQDQQNTLGRLVASGDQVAIDVSFKEWYDYYATINRKYKDFLLLLQRYEELVYRVDVISDEGAYKHNNYSLFFDQGDRQNLDESTFFYLVHLASLTFFFFVSEIVSYLRSLKNTDTGLNSPLDVELKKKLFIACKANLFIDSATLEANFLAALSPAGLPGNFISVKWIKKNRKGGANQTALGALLNVAGAERNRATIRKVFHDGNGTPIILGKLKKRDKHRDEEELSYARYANIFREALATVS